MTFDYEAYLITYTETPPEEPGTDPLGDPLPIGDPIQVPVKRRVLCGRQSVTRAEHYQAAAQGLRPELVLVVNRYEYQGETAVECDGVTYTVARTYTPERSERIAEFDTVELVCVGMVGDA